MSFMPAHTDFLPATTKRVSPVVLSGVVCILEAIMTVATGMAILFLYLGNSAFENIAHYSLMIVGAAQLQIFVFARAGLYDSSVLRRPSRMAGKIAAMWVCVFAALTVLAFLTKSGDVISRVWLASWFAGGAAMLFAMRGLLSLVVAEWTRLGMLQRNIAIVGGGERADQIIGALEASANSDVRICGVFDDRARREQSTAHPAQGSIQALLSFARQSRVDTLILTLPMAAQDRISQLVRELGVLPVDIRLAAQSNGVPLSEKSYSYLGDVKLLEIANRPVSDWGWVWKAAEDYIIATTMLVLLSPVFLVIAALVKLDSKGPVFFKQKRFGFNNELIEVYKFRSLRHESADANAERLVTSNDSRVTKIGKFLRRSSLDELPQLITVLKGGMSIVGPRPHATQAKAGQRLYQDVVSGYYARHRVKPGITGWAQINGWRGETDTEEKILQRTKYDLDYIANWSVLFDLAIILKTPRALLKGENAY
jgi:Undecaprenyl-phosphate glucose phosphotransferase